MKTTAEEPTESRESEPDDDARHERVMEIARRIIERDAALLKRLETE
ncbi:MAG: hypothetical protein JF587_24585 [Catenulisporales bacterium]|nr:hypothetical protein [Catenulisporales bacterium]